MFIDGQKTDTLSGQALVDRVTRSPVPEPDLAAETDAAADPLVPGSAAPAAGRGTGVLMVLAGALGLLAAMVLTIDKFRLLEDPTASLGCNVNPFIGCWPVISPVAGALFGFPNPILGHRRVRGVRRPASGCSPGRVPPVVLPGAFTAACSWPGCSSRGCDPELSSSGPSARGACSSGR